MDDLGTRIKNVLRANEPQENTTDQKYSPPGSYPEEIGTGDGSTNAMSSSEHNKLHKPNDPRAGNNTKKAHGHRHADSGVGLINTHDSTLPQQPGVTGFNEQDDTRALGDKMEQGSDPGTTGTTSFVPQQGQVIGDGHTGDQEKLAQGDSTSEEHPYWGNLPHSTGGVYNTVVGHGSPEDEVKRHQEIHHGTTSSDSPMPTSDPTSQGPATTSNQRTLPLDTDNTYAEGSQSTEEQGRSRSKDVAAATTAAGVAGVGAYKLNKENEESENHTNDPKAEHSGKSKSENKLFGVFSRERKVQGTDVAQEAKHTKSMPEPVSKTGHSYAKQPRHAEGSKKPENPEEKKDHKLFGLFHRKSMDKKKDVVMDPRHQREPETSAPPQQIGGDEKHIDSKRGNEGMENKSHESRDHRAAAAIAAGGATAYAASPSHGYESHDIGGSHPDRHLASQQPLPTAQGNLGGQSKTQTSADFSGTQIRNTQSHDRSIPAMARLGAGADAPRGMSKHEHQHQEVPSMRDASYGTQAERYNVLASGRPSEIKVEDDTALPRNTPSAQSDTAHPYPLAHGSSVGAGVVTAIDVPGSRGTENPMTASQGESRFTHTREQRGILSSGMDVNAPQAPRQDEPVDKHYGTIAATALGVGAGAGALASREKKQQQEHTREPRGKATWKDLTDHPASAAVPTTTSSKLSNPPQEPNTGAERSVPPHGNTPPAETRPSDASHHGKYNLLASGTPSGIRIDDVDDTNKPVPTNETQIPKNRKHDGAKAAAVGFSASGVGAAAYSSQRPKEDRVEKPLDQKQEEQKAIEKQESLPLQSNSQSTPKAGAFSPTQTRVTHRCTKCGEENDISGYFKND